MLSPPPHPTTLSQEQALKKAAALFMEITALPMIPYEDYTYLQEWYEAARHNEERLLLLIYECLEDFHQRHNAFPHSLKALHHTIIKQLQYS